VTRQIVIGSRGLPSLRLDPALEQELSGPAPTPVKPPAAEPPAPPARASPRHKISDYSEEEIVGTLEAKGWEIKKAAEQLGVARTTLYDWLDRNPQVRHARGLSEDELARHHRECQGDLDAMSQRLKLSRSRALVWSHRERCYELRFSQLAEYVRTEVEAQVNRLGGAWRQFLQLPEQDIPPGPSGPKDFILARLSPEQVGKLPLRIRVQPVHVRQTCNVAVLYYAPGGIEVPIQRAHGSSSLSCGAPALSG
jgi:transposase